MYYRHDATESEGGTTKNLSVVRSLYRSQNLLLVDNVSANFADNVKNCVPIRPFNL